MFTVCQDTPQWSDGTRTVTGGFGNPCTWWREECCEEGGFKPNCRGGKEYNYPEYNCCACGKKGIGHVTIMCLSIKYKILLIYSLHKGV